MWKMIANTILKLLALSLNALNRKIAFAATMLIGVASVYVLVERILAQEILPMVLTTAILITLPFLLLKALILAMLVLFDLLLIASGEPTHTYEANLEKVRARIARILYEKGIPYQSLDSIALGVERQLLFLSKNTFKLNYPAIMVVIPKPFAVIKVANVVNNPIIARIRRQLMERDVVGVKIITDEEIHSKVMKKYIFATLDSIGEERKEKPGERKKLEL